MLWEMLVSSLSFNRKCQKSKLGALECLEMVMTDTSIRAYLKWFYECFCASWTGCRGEKIERASCCLGMRMSRCSVSSGRSARWVTLERSLAFDEIRVQQIKDISVSVLYQFCLINRVYDMGLIHNFFLNLIRNLLYLLYLNDYIFIKL